MKQPAFLKAGSTIGMIAPSFGVTTEPYYSRYNASKSNLESLGFNIREGENVHLDIGIFSSNTPEKRAKEFMDAYSDPNVDAIFSVGGGELMVDILPYINFRKLRRLPPKWFVGYSDNTNLVFPLTTILDVVSVYGPCATTFYNNPLKYSEKDTIRLLSGEKKFKGYESYGKEINDPRNPFHRLNLDHKKTILAVNYTNPFSGTLVGGCLDCLLTLCGTKFDHTKEFIKKHPEGLIWFLEACDLSLLDVRRGLFQLSQAGWFKNVNGFIIGRPLAINEKAEGIDHYSAVTDILSAFHVPILLDADIGHLPLMLPIKSGARCSVSFKCGNMSLIYED